MQFEAFFNRVSAKVQVTKEQVQACLSGHAIDSGDEIPDRLVTSLESEVVAQYSSAITQTKASPAEPTNKKGEITKSPKQGLGRSKKNPVPVEPAIPSSADLSVAQIEAKLDVINLIRDGEESRLELVDTVTLYNQTFSARLWRDVAANLKVNPPKKSGVVEAAKQGWDNMILELRTEMTEMGIELED